MANFTCPRLIFTRVRFRPSHLFRSVSTSRGSVASSRPIKPDKQSGNTKTFEQKLTKGTKEFRLTHSHRAALTVLTATCLDALFLPFVYFVTLCSKIFSSVLQDSWFRGIWCHSSIKFDRLRPLLVIHRVLAIAFPFSGGVRVRSSSTQFDRLRSSLPFSFS